MKKAVFLLFSFVFFSTASAGAQVSDFEDLLLDSETSWNGSDKLGGFESGGAHFNNFFDDTYGPYWEGFAYSNMTDTQTPDFSNQYSSITGKGVNGSSNYAVSYTQGFYGTVPRVTFPYPITVSGTYVTNTSYAYWSMNDGDAFSKKFGGANGNDPDWFKLTITGKDAGDEVTGTVEFYLADFRDADNSLDYIVDQWTWVDLSSLGVVKTLEFSLSSSDTGDWGMNTPAYFAMDFLNPPVGEIGFEDEDLSLREESQWNGSDDSGGFESGGAHFNNFFDDTYGPYWEGFAYSNMTDTQTPDFSNQYSSITGKGVNGSTNYAVSYTQGFYGTVPRVTFPDPITVSGTYLTNTSYAYWSMNDGDAFSKKFGGANGNDPDWFKLTITGKDAGDEVTGTVEFYLADFRDADNSLDYIVDQWTWVDLSSLGVVKTLEFSLSSSDAGDWGMNTPAYFAMDHLNTCSGADYDQDGIPDNQVVDPSVDLNEDGIADLSQSFIKSLKTIVGNAQMGISIEDSPTVAEIMTAEAVDPAVLANSAPMPAEMPYGLMSFTLKLKPGEEEAEVRVIFSEPVSGVKKWYKYNAKNNNGPWEDYSDSGFVSFAETSSGNAVAVLRLKDGGYGDADGVLNGYIVDPGGLAIFSQGTDNGSDTLSTGSPGGGAGGCFIGAALPSEMNIGTCFLFWVGTVSTCVASFWFSPRADSMASDGINEGNC